MNIETVLSDLLSTVVDPISQFTGFEMGLQPKFEMLGNQLQINLLTGFPCGLLQKSYIPLVTQAIHNAMPQVKLNVTLNENIRPHRTQFVGKSLRGIKNTIAIASGKGGVGKSTVAVNLAIALVRAGARVGILDADIYGPSIPLMLGKTSPVQAVDEGYLPVRVHGLQAMSIGYLTAPDTALIWRGPMLAKSLIQMLDITQWDNLDYLFIDLPPGTGDIQLSLVQKIPLTAAIVVTTPQSVATADAEKALKMFATTNIDVLGLIENMSLHRCSQCGHHEAIFGTGGGTTLAEQFDCELLGQLPLDASIGQRCEQGLPAALAEEALSGPFLQAALRASIALSKRPLNYADKFPPIVQA